MSKRRRPKDPPSQRPGRQPPGAIPERDRLEFMIGVPVLVPASTARDPEFPMLQFPRMDQIIKCPDERRMCPLCGTENSGGSYVFVRLSDAQRQGLPEPLRDAKMMVLVACLKCRERSDFEELLGLLFEQLLRAGPGIRFDLYRMPLPGSFHAAWDHGNPGDDHPRAGRIYFWLGRRQPHSVGEIMFEAYDRYVLTKNVVPVPVL